MNENLLKCSKPCKPFHMKIVQESFHVKSAAFCVNHATFRVNGVVCVQHAYGVVACFRVCTYRKKTCK